MLNLIKNKSSGGKGDPADFDYVYSAFLNKAIMASEFIDWAERVIRDTQDLLPETIYEIASLNKETATRECILEEVDQNWRAKGPLNGRNELLQAIKGVREPFFPPQTIWYTPKADKDSQKFLKSHRKEVRRFKKVFLGIKL